MSTTIRSSYYFFAENANLEGSIDSCSSNAADDDIINDETPCKPETTSGPPIIPPATAISNTSNTVFIEFIHS